MPSDTLEADVAQAFRDRTRIVGRIGQRLTCGIGAVADHQRDGWRGAGGAGGARGSGLRPALRRRDSLGRAAASVSSDSRTFAVA